MATGTVKIEVDNGTVYTGRFGEFVIQHHMNGNTDFILESVAYQMQRSYTTHNSLLIDAIQGLTAELRKHVLDNRRAD